MKNTSRENIIYLTQKKFMLISLGELVKGQKLKITGILHVGAHTCEELEEYIRCGVPEQNIYWVEAQQGLVEKIQKTRPKIQIYQAVVSNVDDEEVEFIITNNLQSSSILELEDHKTEHPHVVEQSREKLKTTRLDTLINKENLTKFNFINLDIQGAELLALQGLGKYLDQVRYIYTEVNVKHLYRNCALLSEIDEFLKQHQFHRVACKMTEHGWGDAFYCRSNDAVYRI